MPYIRQRFLIRGVEDSVIGRVAAARSIPPLAPYHLSPPLHHHLRHSICTFVPVKQVTEYVRNACLSLNDRLRH
jgi:hypothetical protein